jgi:hypothetical protein
MAGEQVKPRVDARVSGDDLPYAGAAGRTRSEALQVLMPDGFIRSLSVYTSIDAIADPGLAALARAGTLHQVAAGVELAVPFTYHDSLERLFVLVLPEQLRHRALMLRAELMRAVAADAAHAVPDYVRDVELVVGCRGLLARLARPKIAGAEGGDEAYLTGARLLAERERELMFRERLIEARERALQEPPRVRLPEPVDDDEIEEVSELDEASDPDNDYEPPLMAAELIGSDVDAEVSGIEEIEELEDGEAELDDGDAEFDEDETELDDSDDLEDADADSVFDDGRDPAFLTNLSEPDPFGGDDSLQLCLTESGGHAWLFVRGRAGSFRDDAQMELLLQLDPAQEPPVVLVSLVFDVDGQPEVKRGVIDPFAREQREALQVLAQHFEVALVSVSSDGAEHFATLHTPREANVRAILAQLERAQPFERERWQQARDALLASPPPWRDLTHPFQATGASEAPLTVTEAAVLLDELSDWLTPERRARVRLFLCVPDEVVDAAYREGIGYALDWGLSLTRELAARALELGIEKDERGLLARRIDGLCRTSREADLGGLEEDVLRGEWAQALEQAARLGVSLSDEARALAVLHAGERALMHANALSDTRDAALEPARVRARAEPPDRDALEELLSRGGYRDVLEACRLSQKLPPEISGGLFACVARRGDPVALDALLTLISFSEPLLVRAGAALALASRRALNALDDLVSHVAKESDAEYHLFAVALGRYGAGSFRAIARALKTQAVPPERASFVYAHLALHGARAQVRAKARARDPVDAQLADRALSLASEFKGGKKPPLGLEQQGPLTLFCEMFDRLCRDTAG